VYTIACHIFDEPEAPHSHLEVDLGLDAEYSMDDRENEDLGSFSNGDHGDGDHREESDDEAFLAFHDMYYEATGMD
jgi:hypothetical protein